MSTKSRELDQFEIEHFIVDNCKNIYLIGYESSIHKLPAHPNIKVGFGAKAQKESPDKESLSNYLVYHIVCTKYKHIKKLSLHYGGMAYPDSKQFKMDSSF